MLLDELDARLKGEGGENLRGVLNTGFHVTGNVVICVQSPDGYEDRDFRTFCPKVLSGIGKLWGTVASRSIPVRLRRASKAEMSGLRKVRSDRIADECLPFARKLRRFATDTRDRLAAADPAVPDELTARQADIWRPLLAIADAAGGHWPQTARDAAIAIHKTPGEETDYGLLLLEDLCDLFAAEKADALFSDFIVEELVKKEDRPWCEYKNDKPLTKRGLSSLLRRFDVRPLTVRRGTETAKGYRLQDLAPVFTTYLPDPCDGSGPPPKHNPSHASKPMIHGVVTDVTDNNQEITPPPPPPDDDWEEV
jgi:hypothetical protein